MIKLCFVIHEAMRLVTSISTFINETFGSNFVLLDFSVSLEEALNKLQPDLPDILIIELPLPDSNADNKLQVLKGETILIGFYETQPQEFISYLESKIFDYLCPLDSLYPTLVQTIDAINRQNAELNNVTIGLSENPLSKNITEREKEVLKLSARGLKNREIARILYISPRTVNFHLQRIYQKLNVHNKTEAVVEAMRLGIIQ